MFNDIQNIIDYDVLTNKNLTFIESNNIDGSFLIHHLLSYCIKRDFKTLLLTLSQTLSHYKSIQVKLGNGAKLTKLIENNTINHVDCLNLTNNYLLTSNDYFLNEIINEVSKQLDNNKSLDYDYLIIDDLTIAYLLTNKNDYKKLYEFIFKIKTNHSNMKIILNMHSFEDINLSYLIKDFAYLADVYFKIDQLNTGYSKEIHGQVIRPSYRIFSLS
jgi:hypothetical protein